MVFFDLSFRSISTEDIVEDERALWTEGIISWLSINRGSYYFKRVQVIYGDFRPCVVVLSGGGRIVGWVLGAFRSSGCLFVCFEQTKLKTQKQDCMQTYFLLTIDDSIIQLD